MLKIYYLGPKGSNTHLATTKFCELLNEDYELNSVHNIKEGFDTFSSQNDRAYLILPLENSIEGTVRETIDNLIAAHDDALKIFGEITLNIEHCILANPGTDLSKVKTVTSHPQAVSQCIDSIYQVLGNDVKIINATSTSEATKSLNMYPDNTCVSIANPLCATLYGKEILKTNISKIKDNKTRFIAITKNEPIYYNQALKKTSIAFSTKNVAGALASVLDVLAYYGINLSHIDSRPSKLKFGEYIFYCELDTISTNNNLQIALSKIKNYTNFLKIYGEYFSI